MEGYPGRTIGAVFEVATLIGIRLFELDHQRLMVNNQTIAQMPSAVRSARKAVKDAF